jgi:hypothetical protein
VVGIAAVVVGIGAVVVGIAVTWRIGSPVFRRERDRSLCHRRLGYPRLVGRGRSR